MLILAALALVLAETQDTKEQHKCKEYDPYEVEYCRECNPEYYFKAGSCFSCIENCLHCFNSHSC